MVMPLQTSDFFEFTYPDLHHGLLTHDPRIGAGHSMLTVIAIGGAIG